MRVFTDYKPEMQRVYVYVEMGPEVTDLKQSRWYLTAAGETLEVAPGAEAPFFMKVDERVAEAISIALHPAPEFSARHLGDALTVRDRLLTLVEKLSEPGHPVYVQDVPSR